MSSLKIGDKIPKFKLLNASSEQITNLSFKGSKLIIYFYPKALTPGCTAQACSLEGARKKLEKLGYQIIGVSCDKPEKLAQFRNKKSLEFELLSDPDHLFCEACGVWGPKKFMGKTFDGIKRTTFVLNESGKVTHIIEKVNTKTHGEDLISMLK